MKRTVAAMLAVVCVLMLAGCQRQEKAKQKLFTFVEENYDAIVEACENQDVETLLAMDGIESVEIVEGYVLVYCFGEGIAPSSQDYGFYYTQENRPVAVSGMELTILCDTEDLTPEGKGYQYNDGNNHYTEQIKDNLYFYSNAY